MTPYWGFITDVCENAKLAEYFSSLKKKKVGIERPSEKQQRCLESMSG